MEPANLDQSELLPARLFHNDDENQETIVKGRQEHINASMCQMEGARMHKTVTSHFRMWFLYAVFHVNVRIITKRILGQKVFWAWRDRLYLKQITSLVRISL